MSVKKTLTVASATVLTAALTLASPAAAAERTAQKTVGRLDTNVLALPSANMAYAISDQAVSQETAHTQGTAYGLAVKQATENRAKATAVSRSQARPQSTALTEVGSSGTPGWAIAVNWAQTRLGVPYVWGGDSMAEGGYDCSGLVMRAYEKAGIKLPRVTWEQYAARSNHPSRSQLRPGDLVFFGTASNIHHVGLYVGSGVMLHAPRTGTVIRFDRIDYMSDYYGATRVV